MALIITTYLWGAKYGPQDVQKLRNGLVRHVEEQFRFVVVTDHVERFADTSIEAWPIPVDDMPLTAGCLARMRLFDLDWLSQFGVYESDRVVSMDLDNVITGKLYPLFYRPEPFMILTGANAANPCPYNGSVWMLRAGYRPDVWTDLTIEAAAQVPHYTVPDDQAWLAHKIPNVTGWKVGSPSGIYGFQKPGWPKGDYLPKDARIVAFFGWRSPEKSQHLDWVKECWR